MIYWANMIETDWKSIFLFKMTVIFFITGASHSMSAKKA